MSVVPVITQRRGLGVALKAYIDISFYRGDQLYFPFHDINVNGRLYHAERIEDSHRITYSPLKERISLLEPVSFVEVLPSGKYLEGAFISKRIWVNAVPFVRRCENFYTPMQLTQWDVIRVFDYVASRYNDLIDGDLNKKLIRGIFRYIRGVYCLKTPRRSTRKTSTVVQMSVPCCDDCLRLATEEHPDSTTPIQVLDYGTGTGLSYEVYEHQPNQAKARLALSGCDVSPKMLEVCRQLHPDFSVKLCPSYDCAPYDSQTFDVVVAVFVAHYFWDRKPYEEIFRLLKPRGLFMFNVHDGYLPLPGELELLMGSVGFHDIQHRTWHIKSAEKPRAIIVYFAKR